MTEKKKMGAGLVLSVITVLVTVAGLVLYMMNCKTNYFVKTTGTDNTIVACLAVAAILEIVMIIVSVKMGAKPVLDIIPVACGVLTAYALIAFVGSRIAAIGSIMTFENNAQNMADLKGAIIGMIVCILLRTSRIPGIMPLLRKYRCWNQQIPVNVCLLQKLPWSCPSSLTHRYS